MENRTKTKLSNIQREYSQNNPFELSSFKHSQRSNSIDSSGIVPTYQQLQLKLSEFEEISFPPLELPLVKIIKKRKKKAKVFEKLVVKESMPMIFSSYYQAENEKPHPLSATATFDTKKHNLGPGTYELHENKHVLGGFLSKIPRFDYSIIRNAEEYLENKKKKELMSIEKLSTHNLSQFSKTSRLESLKEASIHRKFEETVHKRTKDALAKSINEKRLFKYNDKITKYE